jgi:hypothetical protein
MGGWQMCHYAAMVVQILVATRTLGLRKPAAIGLCYMGWAWAPCRQRVGPRSATASAPGPAWCWAIAITARWAGCCWRWRRPTRWGVAAFALMLMLFTVGAVLIFINFLACARPSRPSRCWAA